MKLLPSLKQLEYLVALDRSGQFGKAAESCHITASTLSAGIRDLEHVLGVAVAERSKRQVLMTPAGREIAARARELLRDAEDIMQLAAARQQAQQLEAAGLAAGIRPVPYVDIECANTFFDPEPSRLALGLTAGDLDDAIREQVEMVPIDAT